jgi:REP element-mobilizing transposase RayT
MARYCSAQVNLTLRTRRACARSSTGSKRVYGKENVVWSPGYFVSSVGLDEDTIEGTCIAPRMAAQGHDEYE